jgi:hypothetical protein
MNSSHVDTVYDIHIASLENIACNLNILIMTVGIVLNMGSIWAFLQKKLLCRKFNWYLLVLTIFELIFCITVLTDYMFSKFYIKPIFLHDFNKYTSIIFNFTIHTSDDCIVILALFLSIDRLYAIKKPLKIKLFITNLHAKKLIIISILMLIFLKSLYLVFFNTNLYILYHTLITPVFFNTIPLIIILILNTILVKEVIIYYKKQSKNVIVRTERNSLVTILEINDNKILKSFENISSKKIRKTQKSHFSILIVSNLWYLFTSVPYFTLNTFFILLKLQVYPNIYDIKTVIIIQIVSSILFNSNHCINFFIYFCFYDEFRNVILKKFSKNRLKRLLSQYSQNSRSTSNSIKLNIISVDSTILTIIQ